MAQRLGALTAAISASALEVFAHVYENRGKPLFGISDVAVNGETCAVTETESVSR